MDMSHQNQRLILTDCDGVLLNWEWAFHVWMSHQGHAERNHSNKMYCLSDQYGLTGPETMQLIRQFNESAGIGFLPALRDATHYVKLLHEKHGYRFRVISSVSEDPSVQKLRRMNLHKIFGPEIFEDIICLPTAAEKHSALEPYRDSGLWWIEDKQENTDIGHEFGLRSVLVEHGYNMYHRPTAYPVVKDWSEIYQLITESSVSV